MIRIASLSSSTARICHPPRQRMDTCSPVRPRTRLGMLIRAITALRYSQTHNRCAPAARLRRSIAKRLNRRRACEDLTDRFALHADSPAVDDPDITKAAFVGFFEITLYRGLDVAWLECMEVEDICDRNLDHSVVFRDLVGHGLIRCSAGGRLVPAFV